MTEMQNLAFEIIDGCERLKAYSQFATETTGKEDMETMKAHMDNMDSAIDSIVDRMERMKEAIYSQRWRRSIEKGKGMDRKYLAERIKSVKEMVTALRMRQMNTQEDRELAMGEIEKELMTLAKGVEVGDGESDVGEADLIEFSSKARESCLDVLDCLDGLDDNVQRGRGRFGLEDMDSRIYVRTVLAGLRDIEAYAHGKMGMAAAVASGRRRATE